ncbi:protein of unknown function [Flavobacterium saccharophilum]|uniref:DUF4907 domain-containing protein n=2 Tax=Flavobacterium saccharophilum TaxID=29534 RepID=A0A1M7LNM9_9FLAO|nr:protein of unknown function [Flavobacterium saccharophilum]
MIINTKKQLFWNKIQKNLLFFILVLLLTACTRKESFKMETFKTKSGWGYSIASNDRVLIKQSLIPVINETKSFFSESDALKVGTLVVDKLNKDLSPTVTKNDLILLKIKL